jgi:serine/threonine protein kinase
MNAELIRLATKSLGQKIEGKYHLKQFLGSGSYGVVFLADEVDQEKDCPIRQVAVKLMSAVDNINNKQELQSLLLCNILMYCNALPMVNIHLNNN